MEIVKESILELLSVSVIVSSIVMIIIQKFKHFAFVNKNYQIGLLNFAFSFIIGIPFSIYFYDFNFIESCWVSLFSLIGAPSIYDVLKNQKIINYTPKSLDSEIVEIKRDDVWNI